MSTNSSLGLDSGSGSDSETRKTNRQRRKLPGNELPTIDRSNDGVEKTVEVGPKGRFTKLNTILGKGAYKMVYKAIDREEGLEVAWNCFQLKSSKSEHLDLSQEIEILKSVRHPNIIAFHDAWYKNPEFVFITELMTSGTLREYIPKLDLPNIKVVKRWSRQILKGLAYLHTHDPPIIHRDIKCDNIFINGAQGEVKIGDMGTAKMKLGKKYTIIGTPEFMAPEMYEEKGYSEKVDIYAFGMCLLEMITGEYPYSECKNAAQVFKKVSQGIKPACLAKVQDPEILALIQNCLSDENDRYTAQEILDHPFLAADPEVVMLTSDETKTQLILQVVFKGTDTISVKFDFKVDSDTAEEVVREMIEENVLPKRYQHLITFEINRILKELNKALLNESISRGPNDIGGSGGGVLSELDYAKRELAKANERAVKAEKKAELSEQRAKAAEERTISLAGVDAMYDDPENQTLETQHSKSLTEAGRGILANALKRFTRDGSPSDPSEAQPVITQPPNHSSVPSLSLVTAELEGVSLVTEAPSENLSRISSIHEWKTEYEEALPANIHHIEYTDDCPIEDIVKDVAIATNRSIEKAHDWLVRLHDQDIVTVGDLRELHDEDWVGLGLTVFARRALRNALYGRLGRSPKPLAKLSANSIPTGTIHGDDEPRCSV
ncbi:kinase-like protein [Basidiobolus meristosporus CBS 931.73]|uniref:Kinase-like protein n=1 Tax=Basidiobolus meristosporus CBS 931.73 TaxID=1314790 RepID=A0A1Y1YBV5_9FUNG|nr:kinase-like protein [Basidiobolus meristosporus CBS 931.73]|eukprot:ORX95084.1 kinase-like protein [Basidiobolus meristosporus CBS 931.73]